jgi:hypothetical protein
MTTYIPLVIPAFVGLHRLERDLGERWRVAFGLALASQLAWLTYDPRQQIPGPADYEACAAASRRATTPSSSTASTRTGS